MRAWLALVAAGCLSKPHAPAASDAQPPLDATPDTPAVHANYVFATSTYTAPMDIGGLVGADQICRDRAQAGGLPGTYVAWLSTTAVNARDRLGNARGWVRTDGLPFADTVAQLVQGQIYYPVLLDESGHSNDVRLDFVVTGTTDSGVAEVGSTGAAVSCLDWTGNDANGVQGGFPDGTTAKWTAGDRRDCVTPARLYCFGIDLNVAVAPAPPPASAKIAFVLSSSYVMGVGLGQLDVRCTSVGQTKYPGRNFAALLATTQAPASAQFTVEASRPWVRPDGTIVSTDLTTLEAPISQDIGGLYQDLLVFGGATTLSQPATDLTDTCNDWKGALSTETGLIGVSDYLLPAGFGSTRTSCDQTVYIYCLEQ